MGYVFDFHDATAYEKWFLGRKNHSTAELECRLMLEMLKPTKGESVLDIGCGTGASIFPFVDMGLEVTGIDPSPYMLDIASRNMGTKVDFHRGFAEDLPFDDNTFNHACFFTSLEFVDDPEKAIAEAMRVAKDRLFIGVLNRYAFKSIQRRIKGIFTSTIYNRARFYSIWELKTLIKTLAGPVPVSWRTVCQLPVESGKFVSNIEKSELTQRFPFGAFAGMVATLTPRFKARPLSLRCRAKSLTGIVV